MSATKISMNMSDEALAALRELAERYNITMTEAARRAITVMKLLDDSQRDGRDVLLRNPETQETDRLIFQ
jgi:hypothetical protein